MDKLTVDDAGLLSLPLPAELRGERRAWLLPILHGRVECAHAVATAIHACRPDALILELPATVEHSFREGVARLPRLSVVQSPGRSPDASPRYLLIEPAEPLVEAFRRAAELDIPVCFGDIEPDEPPQGREPWPDPFAASVVGYGRYIREILPFLKTSQEPSEQAREQAMAHTLQACLRERSRVLLVCGIAHVPGLVELCAESQPFPLVQRHRGGARLLNLHPDSTREVLSEMPFLQRAWEKARNPAVFQEPEQDPPPPEPSVPAPDKVEEISPGRARFKLLKLHVSEPAPAPEPAAPSVAPLLVSPPTEAPELPDRVLVHLRLCRQASARSEREENAPISTFQIEALLQYARNLAFLENQLQPGVFDLLLAARGVADDNFAWWFWDEATRWPWQREQAEIPTLKLRLEDLQKGSRTFHFHRRQQSERVIRRILRPRPREARPGEWAEQAGPYHCSHPPEDIAIEGYASFLRKRTTGILSAEQSRVEPFSTSILDGIDLRETIRNLAHDGRVYVRENRPVKGKVGSVILIFDEDPGDGRYPFRMTWQGEHEQESDMAFYSTEPGVQMVGPGISRCEYGGLLMTWPPHRMFGVWEDQAFEGWPQKHERLCLAGILYSEERIITYIAAKPPRPLLRSIADRFGRKLVYIPLGQLSPVTLKRIRSFHILHGKWVRSVASDYIR